MGNKRRRRRKKTKFITWFKRLSTKKKVAFCAGTAVGCLLIAGTIYVSSKFSMINREKIPEGSIVINEQAEEQGRGYTNFVLFGGDSRTGNLGKGVRTDSIILVNLNNETKEVKMVSVYRDTLLDLSKGKTNKANAAYSAGGAKQAINMLNMNLDMNIQKFVTVDFASVSEVIDLLGGIEVDVSAKEVKAVNKYIDETAQVAGKKAIKLKKAGLQTLDGVQATTYSRIRKGVGDDYQRTIRQRMVIEKTLAKAVKSDLATINKIIDKVFPTIYTNFSMSEMLSYAKDLAKYKITESQGFPTIKTTATIPGKGSCVIPLTLTKNVQELHKFLYGTEDYDPSSKVDSISSKIQSEVGNRKPDSETPSTNDPTDTEDPSENDEQTNNPTTDKPNTPDNECTHEINEKWTSGKDGHWHQCSCGKEKLETEDHIPGDEATETTPQKCTVCGYVIKEATCDHEALDIPKYNSTEHWFECACGKVKEEEPHDLEEQPNGSKKCQCGYTEEPSTEQPNPNSGQGE